jgi:lipopolysaccharide/colanic/teichoic acid biosynthesis glycosyltransferase
MTASRGHDNNVLIALELLFLLFAVALLRILFAPLSYAITTVLIVWALLAFASYLVGEFESTARTNYGLTTRTQAAFALTYVAYSGIHALWSWCEPLTVGFWLALWFYLTFIAPLIGIILRRLFPEPVLFVTDFNQNKSKLLRWWGFDCTQIVPIEDLERWLKTHSEKVGQVRDLNTIIVDICDPRTEHIVATIAPRYFIDFIGVPSFKMSAYLLGPHPRSIGPFDTSGIGRRLKRLIDLTIACLCLLILGPLMLVIALLVKITSSGPVFYRHRRLGRNMREFDVLKFRTMFAEADKILDEILKNDPQKRAEFEKTFKLKDDPRITPLGKWLRRFSLDELPQFINVLTGEMSVVGPRPIVEKEVNYYLNHSLLLFRVPPGLTGLWQISGRTETTYEQRVGLDTKYVREWSLLGDLMIIFKTIPAVLSRRGAY